MNDSWQSNGDDPGPAPGAAHAAFGPGTADEEQSLYRDFLEAAPDPVFILGIHGEQRGRILDLNAIAARSHGYEVDELIGEPIGKLDVPDDAALAAPRIDDLLRTGHATFEVTHLRKDGTQFPVEVTARLATIGGQRCIVSFNRDITDRKRITAELRESQLQLEVAARSSQVGFWNWEIATNKVYFSPEWKRQIGYRPDELEDSFETWHDRVHPDDLERALEVVRDHLHRPESHYENEFRLRHKDGSYRWILAHGAAVRGADGNPLRLVGCHLDITSRKQAENERAEMSERLSQMQRLEAIGTLAGGIAHDFNNILSIIGGNVELALDELPMASPEREPVEEIGRAAERARSLVRQILAFSRNEPSQLRHVRVRPVVEEAVRLLRSSIPKNVDLAVELPSEELAVQADQHQLHQIFVNLATNAWHAIGDRSGTITIRAMRTGPERIGVEVSDDGPGMTESVARRIFEPFFTTKPPGKGSGLGLSVVHGIVENHQGTIEVASTPGEGTTFRIDLPAAAEADPTAAADDGPQSVRARLLLVDDDSNLLRALTRGLQRRDFAVTEFTDPEEALAAVEAGGSFDVLITDQSMPKLSGVELARAIRRSNPTLPIVLCSGFLRNSAADDAAAMGVDVIVEKPAMPSEIATAIAKLLPNLDGDPVD